jgi:hypothetical protein
MNTSSTMSTVALSLVSHTNVGKTTLARTLLQSDIGEVRDAPHVTEFVDGHELVATAQGDRLLLWDTPGFGDSVRLLRRMKHSGNPVGWFLAEVWDRWRDRAFWASQQVLRHVQRDSDAVLYLVNAGEPEAGWLAPEMELLGWVGKPVIVLLNQLGAPRTAAEEAGEAEHWRERLARWPVVRGVLPLDAFARCWVHEERLLAAVQRVLDGAQSVAMSRLAAAWVARREATFDASMTVLAEGLARAALARAWLEGAGGFGARVRELGALVAGDAGDAARGPAARAHERLLERFARHTRESTARLLALHGLHGQAEGPVIGRVAMLFDEHRRVSEGRAALLGGALSGALAGLKADLATGGLTLGGGLLAGGLLGALGAAGLARGINVVRGTARSSVTFGDDAALPLAQAAILRYLAVAHFGRGRGDWVQGEAPPHWPAAVGEALAPEAAALGAAWRGRGEPGGDRDEDAGVDPLAAAFKPHLAAATRRALAALYPAAHNPST